MIGWTYGLTNKEEFINSKGTFSIDLSDEQQLNDALNIVVHRVQDIDRGMLNATGDDDVNGFLLLKMIASTANGGKGWFVNKESKVFLNRLEKVGGKELIHFLNDVFFGREVAAVTTDGDARYYGGQSRDHAKIKVRWECFSGLIAGRKMTVSGGWIYTHAPVIVDETAKIYKKLLEDNVKETGKKLNGTATGELVKQYAGLVDSMVATIALPEGTTVKNIIDLAPACMRLLDKGIAAGADVSYDQHLILSFFLKTYMERTGLVEYFYTRNPRNSATYPTVDDFLRERRDLDYIFKQMYGHAGGGTNYVTFSCKKINENNSCPFAISNMTTDAESEEMMRDVLMSIDRDVLDGLDEGTIKKIVSMFAMIARMPNPGRACGLEFQMRFDTGSVMDAIRRSLPLPGKKVVAHPVRAYLDDALRVNQLDQGQINGTTELAPDFREGNGHDDQEGEHHGHDNDEIGRI